jgi:hypothetical protein
MTDHSRLEAEVRRLDAELKRLTEPGVKLSAPRLLERTREYAERYRKSEPERQAARQQADALVPELIVLYTGGSDDDREWVGGLLRDCPTFRWAFGWGVAGPKSPVTTDQMRMALALLSMKDGETDSRDQWVWLQRLCADAHKLGWEVSALLRQAAAWSSGTARFPPAPSTKALLLQFAERFTS